MSYVVINALTVPDGNGEVLEQRFAARAGLVDKAAGFEAFRLLRPADGSDRWGPRTLDLELLLYGDAIVDEPGLQVPHPRFRERFFVLGPLAEIAPDLVDPVTGLKVWELLRKLLRDEGR